MAGAALPQPKSPADLKNVRIAPRQEPFHMRFGRGLKKPGKSFGSAWNYEQVNVKIVRGSLRKQRGVHFKHIAGSEERSDPGAGVGPEPGRLDFISHAP